MKKLRKKILKFMSRYINGTKGVISLFLAILMLPFATIATSLITAARICSAAAIFDEALCNASDSTLGTYDEYLKSRFGLLAMSQNTASNVSGYSTQDLINDVFTYYMDENMKVLSETYLSDDLSATGVYPLADTDVLLSEIYEYGKYELPTKLVIDGLSLDDLLSSLNKNLDIVSKIFDLGTSTLNVGNGIKDCQTNLNSLKTVLESCDTDMENYNDAYDAFKTAVDEYNAVIGRYESEIESIVNDIEAAEADKSRYEQTMQSEKEKYPEIFSLIEEAGNDEDEIESIMEEYEEELADYNEAAENLEDAENRLFTAENDLQNVNDRYESEISQKRSAVSTKKSEYETAIATLANSVKSVGEKTKQAQTSVKNAVDNGVAFIVSSANTVYELSSQTAENQKKDAEKNKKDAEEKGDDDAAAAYQEQIDDADKSITENKNKKAVTSAVKSSLSTATTTINDFANEDYTSEFQDIYNNLITLKSDLNLNYEIPTDNTSVEDASGYYVEVEMPITSGTVTELLENLMDEIANSSFMAFLKAVVSFVKAIFYLSFKYDGELTSVVNDSLYSNIGGLPSTKDRSSGSPYSLESEFEADDSAKSDYYKSLLGQYSNGSSFVGSTTMEDIITAIFNDIDEISENCNGWSLTNFLKKLSNIFDAVVDLFKQIGNLITNIISATATTVYHKILLAGYIAYNTSNRTTYTGSALTGASYKTSLPSLTSTNQGYAFYGAETEYILNGSLSEKDNQEAVTDMVYVIRLLFDIVPVLMNSQVQTIAETAGAATFGIGYFVVIALVIIAEPLVDTVLLVNGGDVPIIKQVVYLSPTGIVKLVSKLSKITLSSAMTNTLYQQSLNVVNEGFGETGLSTDYKTASKGEEDKTLATISFDYTKTLLLLMMFKDSDKMLDRLTDIIQMECSYNAVDRIDNYVFNLDESYTYLRVSGSFSTNEFISMSSSTGILTSGERIIYRGY